MLMSIPLGLLEALVSELKIASYDKLLRLYTVARVEILLWKLIIATISDFCWLTIGSFVYVKKFA